jgi:hypothetical protein
MYHSAVLADRIVPPDLLRSNSVPGATATKISDAIFSKSGI